MRQLAARALQTLHVVRAGRAVQRSPEEVERRKSIRQGVQYTLMMIVALISCYGAWRAVETGNRLTHDEHSTCVIQARGLPAGHQQAASWQDIHKLITLLLLLPPTSPARPVPPADRQQVIPTGASGATGTTGVAQTVLRGLAVDLNGHLTEYLAEEAMQPGTRHCS